MRKAPPTSIFRRLRDGFIVAIAATFIGAIPKLSLRSVDRLARLIGWVVRMLPGRRHKRVAANVDLALPAGKFPEELRERTKRETYHAFASFALLALWSAGWKPERDNPRVTIENPEVFERTIRLAKDRGKGLVIFSAHLGVCSALGPWLHSLTGMKVMNIGARQSLGNISDVMVKHFAPAGVVIAFRGESAGDGVRHLAEGNALMLLVDHNLKGPGIMVPFFGKEAHTILAPAKLVIKTGAVAATMFARRDGPDKFIIWCDEPYFRDAPEPGREELLQECADLTRQYTARIEQAILRAPDQYFWMHKRWESRKS